MYEPVDIESLDPLYRDVFRDPANGTPDDISTAGCLALAKLGKTAWNAWRNNFPAWDNEESGDTTNNVDFSNVDFTIPDEEGRINRFFNGFNFGNRAMFTFAKFPDHTSFSHATFGCLTSFEGAVFGVATGFQNTCFENGANFDGSCFMELGSFKEAIFQGTSSFLASPWENITPNTESQLLGRFRSITFSGARFLGDTDFSGRIFEGACSFAGLALPAHVKSLTPTIFEKAPKFHNCKLHQDTTFDGAVFPHPSGSNEAARAYRTLKLAFSQQQAVREEQRFFKLEMAEEAARATGIQKFFYKAYAACSDYGFSVGRPLALLGLSLLAFSGVYGFFSWLNHCLPTQAACQFNPSWAEFSLIQALPLPGLDKLSDALRGQLFLPSGWISIFVTMAVILHKTVSIAALFLAGLALRNLFKLK